MEILHLTLKKRWFDMVLYDDKRDEYRDIKPYWTTRLCVNSKKLKYTHIKFTNGYGITRPCFVIKLKEILIGIGNPKWGAPVLKDVYILKLGDIIATN